MIFLLNASVLIFGEESNLILHLCFSENFTIWKNYSKYEFPPLSTISIE